MFGVNIPEYYSIYLTIPIVLVILFLSYQWWRKEKRIKSLPKIIIIAAAGFIFYKLVFWITTLILFLGLTAKDHFSSEIRQAKVIDFKIQKSRPSRGALSYPVVEYKDHQGFSQKIITDTGFGSSDAAPKLHDQVKIVVDEKGHKTRLITDLKIITLLGTMISVVFGLIILAGITEYALSLGLEKVQIAALFVSFYILIPLLITGAAFFFGKSAWNTYTQNHFSGRFWLYTCITISCLLFMTGYINIGKEESRKKKNKKK